MRGDRSYNLQPSAVIQYAGVAASDGTRGRTHALHLLLTKVGIPVRNFGQGFGSETDGSNLADLPAHRDFVLILHDDGTLTCDDIRDIANLSAPILLLRYSTPDNGNGDDRPRCMVAAAALGMDPAATLALRKAGFAATTFVLPAVEDLAAPAIAATPFSGGLTPFTIIAPGDLTPQNDALTLIAGFAAFRQKWARPSRLYLLGRTLDARVAKALQEAIGGLGLQDAVTITGSLDADCQRDVLSTGDLCVVLTAGGATAEIPASSGLPVLVASLSTLNPGRVEAGLQHSPGDVLAGYLASRLLQLAETPGELAALAASQQPRQTSAETESGAALMLFNALGRCGLALPISPAERGAFVQQLRFTVAGHFEGSYSIAAVNRMLAAALEARSPGSVNVLPVAHHQILDVLSDIPPAEDALQQRLFAQRHPSGSAVVAITQHFPPWPPDIGQDLALSLFTWEESLVPAEIVHTLNTGFSGIAAVSRFAAKVLIDSGVRLPVCVTGQAVDVRQFQELAVQRQQPAETQPGRFVALHVSSCFPRKGADVLLQAWAKAFTADDDVCLVIKTFPNPHQNLFHDLERMRAEHPNLATVELVDGELDEAGRRSLYLRAHCMVLPTRGEGFNMVAAEAMLAKLPLIVTGFSGHLDFVNAGNARLLDFRFMASGSHVAADGALWAEPDLEDLASALREAFTAHQNGENPVRVEHAADITHFDAAAWAAKTADFAADLLFDVPRSLQRIAWVSSWAVQCGIAEYSKALLEHRKIGPGEPDVLILCDMRTVPVIRREVAGTAVLPVWGFGAGAVAAEIAPHLKSYDPEILIIQHQDGLISWEDLVAIIDRTRQMTSRVILFLHSTAAIAALYHKLRATVLFALALVDRVAVHTLQDVETLRRLGLFENVTVLPHGAAGRPAIPKAGPVSSRRESVIGCYGFFLPHKGIAVLIESFAEVLKEWPGARLRLINSAFPSELSSGEIKACRALVRQLRIDHAVDWHVNYLEEAESQKLLSGCDLIVLPYDQTPESASGAVRHALASGSPVAVSHSAIFDELGQAVHRVDASGAAALFGDLAALLRDAAHCRSTLGPAAIWLGRHDWSKTAQRLFGMAEGLWQMRGNAAPNILTLTPRSDLLESKIGRRTDRQLIFAGGEEGYGLYGPYVTLGAGTYKATFIFDPGTELSGNARFEIISQISGHEATMLESIFTPENRAETVLHFSLAQTVPEMEFRIFCQADFKGAFDALSIEYLPDQ